jgi:hypothetical protein
MKNGDISNETPRRLIIHADVIWNSEIEIKKTLFKKTEQRKLKTPNSVAISELWRQANRFGLSVELVAFANDQWTQELLDEIMDKLERKGGNPVNYTEIYDSVDDLVFELPYRINLLCIVDTPKRITRYGSYGKELHTTF